MKRGFNQDKTSLQLLLQPQVLYYIFVKTVYFNFVETKITFSEL